MSSSTTLAPGSALPDRVHDLVETIQRLSMARSLPEVQQIVRHAARRLTGADGATFVLRDGTRCFYADEDAISPLWKGQRFPLQACISGWTMLNRRSAAIEDIYADERIPHDAYRPTFVKSLAMVPIRTLDPVGAIGNYWAQTHRPTGEELELLQALADSTAVAIENVQLYQALEQRVAERTAQLQARSEQLLASNRGIQALLDESAAQAARLRDTADACARLARTLAHEVRTPLAAGEAWLEMLVADDELGERNREDLGNVRTAVAEAMRIVDEQLEAARLDAGVLSTRPEPTDVRGLLADLAGMFGAMRRSDAVELVVEDASHVPEMHTDPHLLGQILRNLVSNALKFTDAGEVRIAAAFDAESDSVVFTVKDTGVGIAEPDQATVFDEFAQVDGEQATRRRGTGLGLPLVRRLVEVLGGATSLESAPGRGSTFTVRLPLRLEPVPLHG